MRNEVCQPIVRTLLDHVDSGLPWRVETSSSVPASDYTDPAQLAIELEHLFKRLPQVIALSSELAEPGSHVARDLPGLPVVVTRTADGEAQALVNVCAHRGSRSPAGEGAAVGSPAHITRGVMTTAARSLPFRTATVFRPLRFRGQD